MSRLNTVMNKRMKYGINNAAARALRLVLLACAVFITSCSIKRGMEFDFIKKYGDSDFSALHGKNIFIRGVDENDKLIVFVIDSNFTSQCQSPPPIIIATVAKKSLEVDSIDYKLVKLPCRRLINESSLKKDVNAFLRYNVNSIEVDNYQNVFIGLDESGQRNIVRLVTPERVDSYVKGNLVQVQGNWYKRLEQ